MSDTLTGHFAYRSGFRGKLILKVEFYNEYDVCSDTPQSLQTRMRWRDATTTDVVGLAMLGHFNLGEKQHE